ncbi:MAG: hypothetical protein NTV39_03675 [Candidatus Saccharibacteria bacterium]|nr:hypothetical protein [Candidatus Saccharibacteria bacterium]
MVTQHTRFPNLRDAYSKSGQTPLSTWILYFHTSAEWLSVWALLNKNVHNIDEGAPFFYTKPYIANFALELIVKARIAFSDATFNPRANGHRTSQNIIQYQSVSPILKRVANDSDLIDLIKEYQNTIETRFGETAVQTDSDEEAQIIELVREIRDEMITLTGVSPNIVS